MKEGIQQCKDIGLAVVGWAALARVLNLYSSSAPQSEVVRQLPYMIYF